MKIEEYKNKTQVQKRLSVIKGNYLKSEKETYKRMMKDYKSGKWALKPTPVKEQVMNCMDCNEEVGELRAWLLGYDVCKKMEFKK